MIVFIDIFQTFTGLTKEELMKYCNDPFWVRLRWVMFIAFWLIWIGMLVGAIVIIVGAPKCAHPSPKTWYSVLLTFILHISPSYKQFNYNTYNLINLCRS